MIEASKRSEGQRAEFTEVQVQQMIEALNIRPFDLEPLLPVGPWQHAR